MLQSSPLLLLAVTAAEGNYLQDGGSVLHFKCYE